ncbi:winged helix-turn-helix domain-containing protein [Candidatus Methylobacter favarea]
MVLCRNLRTHSAIPVIMLTARGDETARIVGLEMGGDDYLPKPFNPRQLLARIKSVLRRMQVITENASVEEIQSIRFAPCTLDVHARHLIAEDGLVVNLSGAEFRLLKIFLEHPNRVLNREQLLDLSQGRDQEPFDCSIDVQVSRLRQRLRDDAKEPGIIKTVRGENYIFATPVGFKS